LSAWILASAALRALAEDDLSALAAVPARPLGRWDDVFHHRADRRRRSP